MVVEDAFAIEGRGLVLIPGLENCSGKVELSAKLVRPDGRVEIRPARLELEHLYRRSEVSGWKWFIILPGASKDDVPSGTRVILSEAIQADGLND